MDPVQKCQCPHHKIVPGLIVLLGLLFLANALMLLNSNILAILWPITIVLIGLNKMFAGACKCCSAM